MSQVAAEEGSRAHMASAASYCFRGGRDWFKFLFVSNGSRIVRENRKKWRDGRRMKIGKIRLGWSRTVFSKSNSYVLEIYSHVLMDCKRWKLAAGPQRWMLFSREIRTFPKPHNNTSGSAHLSSSSSSAFTPRINALLISSFLGAYHKSPELAQRAIRLAYR